MKFLKENSFLLMLVGIVVLLGGVMMVVRFSAADAAEERVERRTKLSGSLKALTKAPVVNQAVLDNELQRVTKSQAAAQDAIDQSVAFNRGSYRTMELTYTDQGQQRTIPAFPIQRREYRDFRLVYTFMLQYEKELSEILNRLNATRIPTQEEIAEEQGRLARKMAAKKAAEERKSFSVAPPKATSTRRPSRRRSSVDLKAMEMEMLGKGPMAGMQFNKGGASRSNRMEGIPSEIAAEAELRGLESIRVKRARLGRVYADMGSLDPVFAGPSGKASDSELWQAQLNLWVTSEVVDAIRRTNDRVLSKLPEDSQSVINAPVKRLVSLQVDREYCVDAGATGASKTSGMPGKMGGMPMMDMKMGMPMDLPQTGDRRSQRAARSASSSKKALSQRICTQDYDVIHYDFTVIMPLRYLPDLQLSLLSGNNHTVLDVNIQAVSSQQPGSRGMGGQEGLYYYGTDPVVEVALGCEVLFMTNWERGDFDDQEQKWSEEFPPLVPVEVLRNLKQVLPGAIRPEDEKRLVG